jgi:molybdate transport system regulatory protein
MTSAPLARLLPTLYPEKYNGDTSNVKQVPKPRLRILLGAEIAVGPGKADLLEALVRTGSISAAAREMDMSYRRAWLLVDTMNRSFRTPLVETSQGGAGGGGAQVTALGLDVLVRYRAMEARAAASIADEMRAFSKLLSKRDAE